MSPRHRPAGRAQVEAWWPPRKSRWRFVDGRQQGRVFVAIGQRRRQLRVLCRVESDDHADGLVVAFNTCDFRGRASRLEQVTSDQEALAA